jgi:nitroimidazol reductase NimA-like FMN-containing flavoprotein (pyridoxamine 5'-phosphate oxidase superfamily)
MRETAGVPTPPAQLDDDVLAFLRERHLSTLTTLRPDGSPHVVPVGFTWDEEALVAG